MPASPSDGRGRWKKRKRERRAKHHQGENDVVPEEDEEDEKNNNNDDDLDNHRDNSGDDAAGAFTDPSLAGPSESEVLTNGGIRISEFPAVVKRTVKCPHGSVMAIVAAERAGLVGDSKGHQQVAMAVLENVSHGQLQAVSLEAPVVDPEKYVITPPPIMEGCGVVKRFGSRVHVVPMHSAAPSHESWNGGCYLKEDPNGEVHVPSAALKSIDGLIKFDKPKCRLKAADVYSSLSCNNDDFFDLDNRIRERLSENHCSCCSQPIPTSYYQSQKEVDTLLCSDCFHDGRFVSGLSSIDFVRVDSTKDYGDLDGENWSDQETLLLLEAMEIYNENWNEIAEHVGTKSKAQCILHFLRLPMEDGLLENMEVPSMPESAIVSNGDGRGRLHSNMNGSLPGSSLQDADSERRLPFANSGNPVMAMSNSGVLRQFFGVVSKPNIKIISLLQQVAFLASAVGPRVAAACAHASLAALSEDVHKEGSGHGNRLVHVVVFPKPSMLL
ncbi:SWI/SNF complex subunit SWI3C-like isoform X5 [Durio zibethinus]|uniref:SWI/SNF complex subunit SWI3C-like isoform X5 n=1 Tax=Durio zibethinus TaxID=66656 RepID=A0A6P6ATB5_DURZI|nr:SWI/SNF complex subunit SWI3C-like isoform X5 [Durio zibethinus]